MRVFSGIRASGDKTLGNYSGGYRQYRATQEQGEAFFCIVDLHSITTAFEPDQLREATLAGAAMLFANGLDPDRSTVFVQSHVTAHPEGAWLLGSVTSFGELRRMTQFKDKSEQQEFVSGGLFTYPVLMAADILLYRADLVPVGEDQTQHLELAREIARKWNSEFGGGEDWFPEPKALLTEAKRILGLDGQAKMSKSLGNTIGLMDTPEEIWQKLRPAKTDPARVTKKDPGTPEICNLYHLHKYFSPPETVELVAENCRGARWGCLDCKRVLADNMIAALAPIRARALELQAQPGRVDQILGDGAATARRLAGATMCEVRARMGLLPPV
jgi:tryptophanyl-tRNA synthetase